LLKPSINPGIKEKSKKLILHEAQERKRGKREYRGKRINGINKILLHPVYSICLSYVKYANYKAFRINSFSPFLF
jgi:hypothetical protein